MNAQIKQINESYLIIIYLMLGKSNVFTEVRLMLKLLANVNCITYPVHRASMKFMKQINYR